MSDGTRAAADRLATAFAEEERGPRRNGVFALWLFVRVAADAVPPEAVTARAHRRRVEALERRLSSVSMAPPLRRALATAVRQLEAGDVVAVASALQQLVAPARETVGGTAADVVAAVARAARVARNGEDA